MIIELEFVGFSQSTVDYPNKTKHVWSTYNKLKQLIGRNLNNN